jgi:hypothetical protein
MNAPASTTSARTVVLVVVAYLALSLAYTWPLALHLTNGIAHDPGDPVLNAWILWWSTQTIPLTAHWWNAPFFYPAPGVLAFSEHLLGLAPISAPLIAIGHSPLVGYNVAIIASFVLSGLGAHFLAYTLTDRHDAAFVAGVAYAFAPYRIDQIAHIQVLSSYWAPVCLAALHRYVNGGRVRWATVAATAWFMQAMSCGYYLFFLATLVALWLVWFGSGRMSLRRVAILGAAFGVAALMLVPVLRGYQVILHDTYGKSRALDEIQMFSADAAGLLSASEDLLVWGWVRVTSRPESALFPGLTALLLMLLVVGRARPFARPPNESDRVRRARTVLAIAFVALAATTVIPILAGPWRLSVGGIRLFSISRSDTRLLLAVLTGVAWLLTWPRVRAAVTARSPLAFYLLAALAMWTLALGPSPTAVNVPVLDRGPYDLLMMLPGFSGLRVPARFWMMALLCISAATALISARLQSGSRHIATTLIVLGLLLDGWPRRFTVVDTPGSRPSPSGVFARLDLPTGDNDLLAMYQQTKDLKPLYNGYSGYFAPHYYALRELLARHDPRILQALAANGPLGIVVDHAGDPDGSIRQWILSTSGILPDRDARDWSSYRLPKSDFIPLPDRHGEPVPIKSLDAFPSPPHAARALDRNLTTRWSGGSQQQSSELTVELEKLTAVTQVILELGEYITDFPDRLQIDVSLDRTSWRTVWIGDTALHAYYAALRHPREVPLVFPIDAGEVRFIRLTQKGFGSHDWSVAELYILR